MEPMTLNTATIHEQCDSLNKGYNKFVHSSRTGEQPYQMRNRRNFALLLPCNLVCPSLYTKIRVLINEVQLWEPGTAELFLRCFQQARAADVSSSSFETRFSWFQCYLAKILVSVFALSHGNPIVKCVRIRCAHDCLMTLQVPTKYEPSKGAN